MSNDHIKKENNNDSDEDIEDSLIKLLDEVKREENLSDESNQAKTEPPKLTEQFFDQLNYDSDKESSVEDDIQKLQQLLEKKKKELEKTKCANVNLKRKASGLSKDDCQAKRKQNSPGCESSTNSVLQTDSEHSSQQRLLPDSNNQTLPSELELEQLLKNDDYNSDEEIANSNTGMSNSCVPQPPYMFPPAIQMGPTAMYNPENQMIRNIAPANYPLMYNMGIQPQFYTPNMGVMQMMGYGLPQINIRSNQDDLECLPVVNEVGYSGMPTFKRIKLEKNPVVSNEEASKDTQESSDNRRSKILEACTALIEKMEFGETEGKFIYTSTVSKLQSSKPSNSIIQKISNISYEFHSIGPQLNLTNWGLKEICPRNAGIAKQIAMDADKYFAKIAEKANTTARKLIKIEDHMTDKNQDKVEMEIEEPTLSTFLKNSVTQTDPIVCTECQARKRIVGHEIAVQATVYTGSIGSQTLPMVSENDNLREGLNMFQKKALACFSNLIRQPTMNSTVELSRLRNDLMEIYNISQRPTGQLASKSRYPRDFSSPTPAPNARDPHSQNRLNSDTRFMPTGMQIPRHITSVRQTVPSVHYRQYQSNEMQMQGNHDPMFQHHVRQPAPLIPVYPPVAMQDLRRGYGRGDQRQ